MVEVAEEVLTEEELRKIAPDLFTQFKDTLKSIPSFVGALIEDYWSDDPQLHLTFNIDDMTYKIEQPNRGLHLWRARSGSITSQDVPFSSILYTGEADEGLVISPNQPLLKYDSKALREKLGHCSVNTRLAEQGIRQILKDLKEATAS